MAATGCGNEFSGGEDIVVVMEELLGGFVCVGGRVRVGERMGEGLDGSF